MPSARIASLTLALVLSTSLAFAQGVTITPDPSLAALSADEMVARRQAIMKEDGGILKGAGALAGDQAVAAADTLITNFSNLTVLFPEGSINAKSEALPAIWENYDAFQAILTKAVEGATAMKVAAQAGDTAGYAAAVKSIGGFCGECHQQFRMD